MARRSPCLILLLVVVGLGCAKEDSGPEVVPVMGTVRLNGEPLPGADVTFIPMGSTPGMGGSARTDELGLYELIYARGGKGAPAGEYRVTVSCRLMPDGSPVPADDETSPIESPAQESLPLIYSSAEQSRLTVTVQPDGGPIEIDIDAPSG